MNIRSLGYRTDMIFHRFDGEITDRGDYLVIRAPANPSFYWGNFLLFSHPPEENDHIKWRDLFAQEIGTSPGVKHQTFGWDSPEGKVGTIKPFLQAGFRLNTSVVLKTSELRNPGRSADMAAIRTLEGDRDWQLAVENQVLCREAEFEKNEYRNFQKQKMARYREMVAAGLGNWFGAFIGGQLIADLGLFHSGGIGRFQSVETHPDFRRRGIAGTLIVTAGRHATSRYGLHTLVIVAEQDSSAARLYASLGFQPAEMQVGLERGPAMDSTVDDQ